MAADTTTMLLVVRREKSFTRRGYRLYILRSTVRNDMQDSKWNSESETENDFQISYQVVQFPRGMETGFISDEQFLTGGVIGSSLCGGHN